MATEVLQEKIYDVLREAARHGEEKLFRALLPFVNKEEWNCDDNSILEDIVTGGNHMLLGNWGEYFKQEHISRALILALNSKTMSKRHKEVMADKLYQILRTKEKLVDYFKSHFVENPKEFSNETVVEIVEFLRRKNVQVPLTDIKRTCIKNQFLDALEELVHIAKSEEPLDVFEILCRVNIYYSDVKDIEKLFYILTSENVDWNAKYVKDNTYSVVGLDEGMTVLDFAKSMDNWQFQEVTCGILEEICKIQ